MAILSPDTWQFICAHRTEDVRTLALQARKYPQVDMAAAVVQIAGWQIAEKKVPLWAQTEGVQYPAHSGSLVHGAVLFGNHGPLQGLVAAR